MQCASVSEPLHLSIEGIDGAGKSSLLSALRENCNSTPAQSNLLFFDKYQLDAVPSYIKHEIHAISALLWERENSISQRSKISEEVWLHLIGAWFHLLQPWIRENLSSGRSVISDYWTTKVLSRYQLKNERLRELADSVLKGIELPQLTVFLDTPPETAARRKEKFGFAECGNFDGLTGVNEENFIRYQTKVYQYLTDKCDESQSWVRIEVGDKSPTELADLIVGLVPNICRDSSELP